MCALVAAVKGDLDRQINDISECSICAEIYSDPRVLPCIHTFCLRCLEGYGKGKKPGSAMLCPLCRKPFAVPKAGLKDLPKNTLAQQLVDTIGCDVTDAKDDARALNQYIARKTGALRQRRDDLDLEWAQFSKNSAGVERDIQRQQDYLKQLIDDDTKSLIDEVKNIRLEAMSAVRTERTEIDGGLARLNSLLLVDAGSKNAYSESGMSKTRITDDEFRTIRAEVDTVFSGIFEHRQELVDVSFQPHQTALTSGRKLNVVGSIAVASEAAPLQHTKVTHRLVKTMMSGVNADGVMGLSVIDNLVYVIRNWATTVDVHDLSFTVAVQRQILVSGLDLPNDMASCARRKCLYITDYSPFVHRVEIRFDAGHGIGGACSKWLAGDGPLAVSVTASTANVIVTFQAARKVKEFSTLGVLLREVSLSPELANPHHAVVLDTTTGGGDLLVCHGFETDPSNRLCVVDQVTGEVIDSMEGGDEGGLLPPLRQPSRIAVDPVRGIAYVADFKNDRVVLVDLASLRSFASLTDVGRRPYAMFVDKANSKFYVGSWEDGQISIVDVTDAE